MIEKAAVLRLSPELMYLEKELLDTISTFKYTGWQDLVNITFSDIDLANNYLSSGGQQVLGHSEYSKLEGVVTISSCAGTMPMVDEFLLKFLHYNNNESRNLFREVALDPTTQKDLDRASFIVRYPGSEFNRTKLTSLLEALDDVQQYNQIYYPGLIDPRNDEQLSLAEICLCIVNELTRHTSATWTTHGYHHTEPIIISNDKAINEISEKSTNLNVTWDHLGNLVLANLDISATYLTISPDTKKTIILNYVAKNSRFSIDKKTYVDGKVNVCKIDEEELEDFIALFSKSLQDLQQYKMALANDTTA